MSTRNTVPPRRPRPIMPIIWAISATAYTALAGYYLFAYINDAEPGYYAIIWGVCAIVWWAFTVPMSIRTHRMRVETWQRRVELHQRLRFLAEDRAGWRAP